VIVKVGSLRFLDDTLIKVICNTKTEGDYKEEMAELYLLRKLARKQPHQAVPGHSQLPGWMRATT
jgi:hypothetical protein